GWCSKHGRHLWPRDNRARTVGGRSVLGEAFASGGRVAADGVSVALSAWVVRDSGAQRRSVPGGEDRARLGARSRRKARHHQRGTRAAVDPGVLARLTQIRAGADQGAVTGRVRRRLSRMGAVVCWLLL